MVIIMTHKLTGHTVSFSNADYLQPQGTGFDFIIEQDEATYTFLRSQYRASVVCDDAYSVTESMPT